MSRKFEEPKFEKTEFEAVAYLCQGSNQIGSGNDSLNPFNPPNGGHGGFRPGGSHGGSHGGGGSHGRH